MQLIDLIVGLQLIFLILSIGVVGWISYFLFFADPSLAQSHERSWKSWFHGSFMFFLTGFGVSSIFLYGLAVVGWFHLGVILAFPCVLLALYLFKQWRVASRVHQIRFTDYLLFCLLLGVLVVGVGKLTRPFEAVLYGDDASVYIGSAFQLARSGSLSYQDPLILEMNSQELEVFLSETKQYYMRFPAGVHILDPSSGKVGFGFFPLFQVWLGLGVKLLGTEGFLNILSLSLGISMLAL